MAVSGYECHTDTCGKNLTIANDAMADVPAQNLKVMNGDVYTFSSLMVGELATYSLTY